MLTSIEMSEASLMKIPRHRDHARINPSRRVLPSDATADDDDDDEDHHQKSRKLRQARRTFSSTSDEII